MVRSVVIIVAVGAIFGSAPAWAQVPNAPLEKLIAAANKEGTVTLSWSQSTLAGVQGAARFQAAMNKAYEKGIDLALDLSRRKGFRLLVAGTGRSK